MLAVLLVPAVAGLGGCGGPDGAAAPATVTVTRSAAAPPGATAASPSTPDPSGPSVGATAEAAPSADPAALPRLERGFDVAYVTGRSDTPDGVVLDIDRLTLVGVDDDRLAAEGAPVRVDDGTRFSNQTVRSYQVGVSPQARFFLTTCTAGDRVPAISTAPVDLDELLAGTDLAATAVSLVYQDGLVVRGETNPRC